MMSISHLALSLSSFIFNAKGEENCCFRDFLYDDGSSRVAEVEDGQMLLEKMEETKHVTYNYSQAGQVRLSDPN